MNRRHLPDQQSHHRPTHSHTGPSVALEMQIRALREALYRAARETESMKRESHTLGESLRRERLRSVDAEFRLYQLQQAMDSSPATEIPALRKENRRLRSLLAEAGAERGKTVAEIRPHAPTQPLELVAFDETDAVSFEG